jgi:hypothetical protein
MNNSVVLAGTRHEEAAKRTTIIAEIEKDRTMDNFMQRVRDIRIGEKYQLMRKLGPGFSVKSILVL